MRAARCNRKDIDKADFLILHGKVSVRDQEVFQRVREDWNMPNAIATQAEHVCQQIYVFLNERLEPFKSIGRKWLSLHPSLVNNKGWMNP
jgi:hypothetical protein